MTLRRLAIVAILLLFRRIPAMANSPSQTVHVYYTQNDVEKSVPAQPVKEFPQTPSTQPSVAKITIDTTRRFQTIAGVGASFSEIGALAFLSLPPDQRRSLLTSLFDAKAGAGFSICRLPIGSSDFATSAYSYDDTPDDYEMKSFTLARDEKSLLPLARAARAINPRLSLFASPWSPPGWMKLSGKIDGGGPQNFLRDEDKIYRAYALYFQKYLLACQAAGLPISRLCPQNEVDMNPTYPGCVMPPDQLVKFVTAYLAPALNSARIPTEIWAGTFRENAKVPWAAQCMKSDPFRAAITGISIQYYESPAVAALTSQYPDLRLMFTEANCYDSKNTATQAQSRLTEITTAFNDGCDSYAYWNMILDETQTSGWAWAQNSLVTIDRRTHEIRYNPDYQPVYLVSRFVRPGEVRVASTFTAAADAKFTTPLSVFVDHDGTVTVLVQNLGDSATSIDVIADGEAIRVQLPPHADCVIDSPSSSGQR